MDGTQLGKRIKEARLRKKMTQSEVVGDFITRNMLSQIESGTAFPSIKTLEYLSKVLEIPIYYLMPDGGAGENSEEKGSDSLLDTLLCGKTQYRAKQYESAIKIVTPLLNEISNSPDAPIYPPALYDEAAAILSRAYLALAREQVKEQKIQQAVCNAKKASEYAAEGLYSSREVRTEALLLLDEISEKL